MRRWTALAIGILVSAPLALPGTAGASGEGDDRRSGHRDDVRSEHHVDDRYRHGDDDRSRHKGWPIRAVQGTMTGPGGFRFLGCAGVVSWVGTGTYEARALGSGTYDMTVCVNTSPFPIEFMGDIVFTTSGGSTLTGTLFGTFAGGGGVPGPSFTMTITGGTGRFARVGGELVLGPFVQSDQRNCNRALICFDWTDTAPINGALRLVKSSRWR
jgi:hypothetical protein